MCLADAILDDGNVGIGSRSRREERERAVAAAHDAQVCGQQGPGGVGNEGEADTRVAAEGELAPRQDDLAAGPVAVEDGQPGMSEQEVREPYCPADAEPDRDEPSRAAGDLELHGRIARARGLGHERLDRVKENASDQAADQAADQAVAHPDPRKRE